MPFAIVDIETTGGYAAANGITEVSIHVFDGEKVIAQYETLINPGVKIPYFISGLTGITDKMVRHAPAFSEVAERIYSLLQGNVFVAHSVNFDYSFLKHALNSCGYVLDAKKLCTVRLSRKIIPGLASYSLGNVCGYLGIIINDRHRAGGDAAATVKLFHYLLKNDVGNAIPLSLKRASKEQSLPPNVPKSEFDKLPQTPGVYYFHDRKGKIVYVGKAINIKKRVSSHFSNNSPARQRQNFMRDVYHINFTVCHNEDAAFALETQEIKRLWPKFNQAQKHYEPIFGIVQYHDQNGFIRLGMQKVKKRSQAIVSFTNMIDGFNLLKELVNAHGLCARLSGVMKDRRICLETGCACGSTKKRDITAYNRKVEEALNTLYKEELPERIPVSSPQIPIYGFV